MREMDINDREMRLVLLGCGNGLVDRASNPTHAVATCLQCLLEQVSYREIVFYDQHIEHSNQRLILQQLNPRYRMAWNLGGSAKPHPRPSREARHLSLS